MAKPPGELPVPPFNLPSGVGLEIWTLLQNSATSQARIETKLDTVVSEQERARAQRGQMFDRFEEQRNKIEQVDRRIDGVARDVDGVKGSVAEIKTDVTDHNALRQQASGGWSVIRALIVAGATIFGGAMTVLLQRLLGR